MSARVCVVGAVHRDVVVRAPRFPAAGETLLGEDFALGFGGKGANQAVAAARLGARVTLIGVVGADEWGHAARAALAAEGIELTHLASVAERPTGVAVITVVPGGENTIVVAPGADHALGPAEIERAAEAIAAADVLLAQGELRPEATFAALERARRANRVVVYNAAPAGPLPDGFLERVDVLVANRGEAVALLGAGAHELAPPDCAQRLARLGPERVVITLGGEGALLFEERDGHAGRALEHVAAFPVAAVDATGAGDAFAAALAVLRAEGASLRDAVRFACAAGALATTRAGALPSLPARAAVDALLARHGTPRA